MGYNKKEPKDRVKKLTTQDQPCKHFRRAGQKHAHKEIKEENCFMNPHKKFGRPPWATKKLKNTNIEIKYEKLQLAVLSKQMHTP